MTYKELKALPDDELLKRGFVRNGLGGLTAVKQPETGKKTFGLVSFAKAMLSGDADPAVQYARWMMCNACAAKDSKGERLFRVIDGQAYCGVPRLGDLTMIFRDEARDGCGCVLLAKVRKQESQCPLNRWPTRTSIPKGLQFDSPAAAALRRAHPPAQPDAAGAIELAKKPCNCGGKIAALKRHLQGSAPAPQTTTIERPVAGWPEETASEKQGP